MLESVVIKMQNKEFVKPIFASIIFFIALVTGFFIQPAKIACLMLACLFVASMNVKQVYMFLLFAFPYAFVFKLSPESTSLFTIVEIFSFFVILFWGKRRSFEIISFLLMMCLCSLMFAVAPSAFTVTSILKLLFGYSLLYFFIDDYEKCDSSRYCWFFFAGLISSSILGAFKTSIPGLWLMYVEEDFVWIGFNHVLRFSGIFADPNYFSIPILLGLTICLLSILHKGKNVNYIIFLTFLILGMLTVSRSFFLVLAISIVLSLTSTNINANISSVTKGIAGMLIILGFIFFYDPGDIISNFLYRMDADDLSTGRTEIWIEYIECIKSSTMGILFGSGIDAPYVTGRAAHNMYIETVYLVGFVGLFLFLSYLGRLFSLRKMVSHRKMANYIGLIILIVLYMFLAGFVRYENPFYLMIAYMIFNINFSKEERLV